MPTRPPYDAHMFHTLAILLTPKSYSIAYATLSSGFCDLRPEVVFEHENVLVLNDVVVDSKGQDRVLNGWMGIADFKEQYHIVAGGTLNDETFVRVIQRRY